MKNKIRIGNQTAFSALTPMAPFEYAVASGFDAFEWFPDKHESGEGWDEGDLDQQARSYIRETALKHDIALSVHASLRARPDMPGTHEIMFRDIEFARDIGAALLNVHLITAGDIKMYVKAIGPVIRRTSDAGIKLSIENTVLTGPDAFNELFALLKKQRGLPVSHVGMCLDIGHANLYGETRNDYLRFMDKLKPQVPIIHVHMHENFGESDSHLTFFTGPAGKDTSGIQGLAASLKKRGFAGSIILEQWPEPPLLLNDARDRLKHMFNEMNGEEGKGGSG